MAILRQCSFRENFDGVLLIQSNGTVDTPENLPGGIFERIEIGDWGGDIGRAGRFTLVDGDRYTPQTPTNIPFKRSEVSFAQLPKGEHFFAYDIFVPGYDEFPYAFDPTTCQMLVDYSDGNTTPDFPHFGGYVSDRTYIPKMLAPQTADENKLVYAEPAPFPRNRWVRVIMHARWASDTTGMLELSVDGRFVFRKVGLKTVHAQAGLVYYKVGLYNINGRSGYGFGRAYFRDVVVYDNQETWLTVNGGVPLPPYQMLVP